MQVHDTKTIPATFQYGSQQTQMSHNQNWRKIGTRPRVCFAQMDQTFYSALCVIATKEATEVWEQAHIGEPHISNQDDRPKW